jgi:hypothetical protein
MTKLERLNSSDVTSFQSGKPRPCAPLSALKRERLREGLCLVMIR